MTKFPLMSALQFLRCCFRNQDFQFSNNKETIRHAIYAIYQVLYLVFNLHAYAFLSSPLIRFSHFKRFDHDRLSKTLRFDSMPNIFLWSLQILEENAS